MLLNELSAVEAARRLQSGEITAEALTHACLDRIAAREPAVKAWVNFDPDYALRQARALDKNTAPRGALYGLPIGIKDVFDTAELPTEMGSPIYKGHRPFSNAAPVASAQAAGAIILGKTVTAEFAGVHPGETTNPLNPGHTPGGSSSGSAAAVADFMAPLAFGTQTGGSILRPASFCGVVGYKPTYNTFSRTGLKLAAESFDTVGFLARDVDDAELLASALLGQPFAPRTFDAPPRIGFCRTPVWKTAEPATVEAVEDAADRLAQTGARVSEVALDAGFSDLSEARDVINSYERAQAMADEWVRHRDLLSPRMAEGIAKGLATPRDTYAKALAVTDRCRRRLAELSDTFDALLAPCVPGEAPAGIAWTGDTRFQAFWTMLHVPTISLPTHSGPKGLPVGIQLVGKPQTDQALLAVARWCWRMLGSWKDR